MIRRIVLVTITSMLLVLATTAASASETAATDPDSLETTSEDIVFIWPPTEMCPGPDEETVWQCFNVKNDGEDVAIISQSISPGFPGLSFNATTTDVEARLLCNGTPLVLASTYDGPEVTWFSFEREFSQQANDYVSNAGVSIYNDSGHHHGQLLACGEWPYANPRVEDGGKPLLLTMETRAGSLFDVALLIPSHWADGDMDDNRVVEDPPDDEPPIGGGDARFLDVPLDHTFNADVEWLAAEGVTRGCDPPLNLHYCPDDPVTRGQMAAFLVRALGLPARGYDEYATFADVGSTHTFFDEVGILGAEGITRGCNPPDNSRFCPDDPVTRGQMAAFLVRALGLPPSSTDSFVDDDGSVFEKGIQALAASGITRGCNPPANSRFCPDEPVSRAQMAAFLHRALGQ